MAPLAAAAGAWPPPQAAMVPQPVGAEARPDRPPQEVRRSALASLRTILQMPQPLMHCVTPPELAASATWNAICTAKLTKEGCAEHANCKWQGKFSPPPPPKGFPPPSLPTIEHPPPSPPP
eukprot:5683188-Prymnesium_polylepis.1